jgi:hypothetical protein
MIYFIDKFIFWMSTISHFAFAFSWAFGNLLFI